MRKRLIALMLMAVFAFEQTNVLTAFAEEYDYMPIYDKDGNTVNVEDALSSRDAGNYVTIFDSEGNEVNIDDVVAEAAEKNKTNDSSSSSDNIYDNANSSGEYTPIYDELGNEVNPVDVLASEKTGINIPIYDVDVVLAQVEDHSDKDAFTALRVDPEIRIRDIQPIS